MIGYGLSIALCLITSVYYDRYCDVTQLERTLQEKANRKRKPNKLSRLLINPKRFTSDLQGAYCW